MRFLFIILLLVCTSQLTAQKIFVVRHAEKSVAEPNMSSDVALSDKGKQRAIALRELLAKEQIEVIYSTNTIRTKTTAQPTAELFGVPILIYGPRPDSAFAATVRASGKNVLIVGHSNTVDDVVNLLLARKEVPGDLDESIYNNLFVISKEGEQLLLEKKEFGGN